MESSMEPVVQPAGNFYDKYNTRNPIARRLMQGFLRGFSELVELAGGPGSALEIGCGEGELSMRLAKRGWRVQGCDIAHEAIVEARRRAAVVGLAIPFEQHDIRELRGVYEPAELVVCCEVLEHLEDTVEAIGTLLSLCRGHLIVSVPREPIWRILNMARGRYLADLGNTPGHIQHWSRSAFLELLEQHVEIVATRTPLPWTQVLCKPKHA
jgi:2-polyprenyl-3-methyl-5-hydroxy-6-metoxy-1,4-benzoquinol methylase